MFAGAVRDALRRGEIDVAVHSLKDLPTAPEEDLEVIAVPAREDPRDVLVGRRLDDLVGPVTIGTGAPRRAAAATGHGEAGDMPSNLGNRRIGKLDTRTDKLGARLGAVRVAGGWLVLVVGDPHECSLYL